MRRESGSGYSSTCAAGRIAPGLKTIATEGGADAHSKGCTGLRSRSGSRPAGWSAAQSFWRRVESVGQPLGMAEVSPSG